MIDLNGFKHINDEFGHAMGDDALVETAHVLQSVVNDTGCVVRYAGDEFVVLLNTHDSVAVQMCLSEIRNAFDEFNKKKSKPYSLFASIGCHKFNMLTESTDEFINVIDRRMYEDKKAFYATHAGLDRRRR